MSFFDFTKAGGSAITTPNFCPAAARFVFGADNATAKALTEAAAGGTEADVKRAQALVKKLPAKDRTRLMAAFQTFSDDG